MDYEIHTKEVLLLKLKNFTDALKKMRYADSTLAAYHSFILKSWNDISSKGLFFSPQTVNEFVEATIPTLHYSTRSQKYLKTSLRRFDDYLCGRPYIFRVPAGREEPPEIYRVILEDYATSMSQKELKQATIDVRRIFATQFLNSIYSQGVYSLDKVTGIHVSAAILSAGSMAGMCQKLPCFLKYLKEKGVTEYSLELSIPQIIEEKKLPTIYTKEELLKLIADIDCSSDEGKRDYTIMLLLIAYGFRAKDLVELKLSDIDFSHRQISFQQSKTGHLYKAELLPAVYDALNSYIHSCIVCNNDSYLFKSIHAPFNKLSRSALWSIVSRRLEQSTETGERKRGSHAIRSSVASGLIADNVPYPIVQKILGHEDPNATKRYVSIDVEQLRKCALECPAVSGNFLLYLEGGCWK